MNPKPRLRAALLGPAALTFATAFLKADAPPPVAVYTFSEGAGDRVHDSSPNHNDGRVIGGAAWASKGIDGTALLFDGRNTVRIPASPSLDLGSSHSIAVWVRGRASATHFVTGYPDIRAPYVQVCGDKLFLATNSDTYDSETRHTQSLRGKDIYHLYTGTADISLSHLQYVRRTFEPGSGFEPKMQVVGGRIYYEYSGDDTRKAIQIWTASSAIDGSDWTPFKRTDAARFKLLPEDHGQKDTMAVDKAIYRVDHGALAVANGRMYIGYPAQDDHNVWQFWTAVCNTDGSDYKATQRTTDHGWIPSGIQAVGDRVYYLFPKGGADFETYSHSDIKGTARGPKTVEGYYVASTDASGGDWKIVGRVGGPCVGGDPAAFSISNGVIHLVWVQYVPDGSGHSQLFTGEMDLDGGHFRRTQRTFETGFYGTSITGGVQAVGNKLYYVYTQDATPITYAQAARAGRKRNFSLWLAESNLDGTGWRTRRVASAPPTISVGYKGQVVIGAKRYLAPARLIHSFGEGQLGFGGANLVNKGDAYGVGMTEEGLPRGFVNAGQDYLFRGEAATDTSGAIADGRAALPDDSWHQIVEVYDGRRLNLYVDGQPGASAPYASAPGRNPFPLVIGDGFIGCIGEVRIYGGALSSGDVSGLFHEHR